MKYHSSLLKKFISVNQTPQEIAKDLIVKTCEIEEIIERKISDLIVIGYVESCEKHPDADKLNICQVNCGDKGNYQIVCGGLNVKAGLFVPVALPGAVFEKAGITIAPRKMRGVESNGMICAKEELDIMEDLEAHGIWDLQIDLGTISKADLGTPLIDKFPRLNSYVFDVDNKCLTNRPDLTGHFGAAVELNAIYGNTIQDGSMEHETGNMNLISYNKVKDWMKEFSHTNILEVLEHATPAKRKLVGEATGLHSYTLLEINNVTITPTSFFTRLQMIDMGASPKNNWVDFSNLFMLLTGQPIHFFDAEKVDGDIIIRNAVDGEEFIDLFGTQHFLIPTDIVIADKNKVLALAGVVGGLTSGISDTTKNILVEIANFDPVAVRKTGTRLSLRTDAELRYEKNINPWWSLYCLLLFLEELKYYAKDLGSFEMGGISSYVNPGILDSRHKSVPVDLDRIEQSIFGTKQDQFAKTAGTILEGLGFGIKQENETIKSVIAPIWRSPDDMNILEDITEEVVRIHGYDNVATIPLLSDTNHIAYTPEVGLHRQLEEILVETLCADQTETYPRVSEKALKQFGKNAEDMFSLQNSVNPETPYLRDDMIYNLLAHAAKNSKFFDTFRIFDIGKIWNKSSKEQQGIYASTFVEEQSNLGVLVYQKAIDNRSQDPLLDAKNIVKTIISKLGLQIDIDFVATSNPSFHPKKQANIVRGKKHLGFIGSIHPLILKDHKIPEQAGLVYITFPLKGLLDALTTQGETKHHYETLQDQILWRDLCFVVESSESFAPILDAVKAIDDVKDMEVFDIYEGKNLGENKKSVSIKIKIVGDGNLTTEAINAIMDKAIKAAEKVGSKLR